MSYQEIFAELINSPKTSAKYLTKLVDFDNGNPCRYKIILAVDKDEDNQQCVMLQLKNGGVPSNIIVNNINTLKSIKIDLFPAEIGSDLDVYYSIKLFQNTEDEIFYAFITDIIATAKNSISELVVLDILKRVKSWMNFFKSKNSGVLGESSQIGLFAELSLLKNLLEHNPDRLLETVLSWVGPKGQNQDFIFSNKTALEIKCTTSNNPFEVLINNEFQLDSRDLEKLFLALYQVKRHKNNERTSFLTLPVLVSEIKLLLLHESDAKFEFEGLLLEAGYLAEAEAEYINFGFQILAGPAAYEIGADFPKLARADMPDSITKVEYKLNIQDQTVLEENIISLIII